MIKAVLIDDERKSRLTLQKLLEKYCADFVIVGVADGVSEAIKIINEKDPDVAFLDIEMGDGSGFDILKKFDDPFFHFVFVTAHSNYAVKAFKFSAIDYLLKPVDIEDLKRASEKIRKIIKDGILLKQFRHGKGKMLKLRDKKDFLYVSSDQIVRLTAQGSYTKVVMDNEEEHLISLNIGAIEEKIDDKDFIRVHRSEIININHIKRLIKTDSLYAELTGGSTVEISRRNKGALFAALSDKV